MASAFSHLVRQNLRLSLGPSQVLQRRAQEVGQEDHHAPEHGEGKQARSGQQVKDRAGFRIPARAGCHEGERDRGDTGP